MVGGRGWGSELREGEWVVYAGNLTLFVLNDCQN